MFDKSIEKMDFKELRAAVQVLYDAYVRLKRSYEDQIYNLDGDNFARGFSLERNGNRVQISITADEVKTMLSNALGDYSTFSETAEAIRTGVYKGVDYADAVVVTDKASFRDKSRIYLLQTIENGEVVSEEPYYYNSLSGKWESCVGGIYSLCTQSAEGFVLKGTVVLHGNLIADADIKGGSFSDADGRGVLTLGTESGFADMTYTSQGANKGAELFKVYEGAGFASLYLFGQLVCTANADGITFPNVIVGSATAVFG